MDTPLYIDIYNKIERLISSGDLLPGERLSGKRELAKKEGVSLNTVIAAYDLLAKNGLIYSIERRGYYVAGDEAERSFKGGDWSKPNSKKYVFSINSNGVNKLTKKLLRAHHDTEYEIENRLTGYKEYTGSALLRERICEYLYKTRHISCTSEQIIPAAGLNDLLNLISRLFPYSAIYAFEDPTEKKAMFALTGGRNMRMIAAGHSGIDIDRLRAANADVLFCMPEKQYPIGYRTELPKRCDLLEWCGNDKYIIEYGLYAEYCFNEPLPSLYELDNGKHVIYVNTLDKVIAPGVSIAYMVLPEQLVSLFKDRLWYHHSYISEYDSLLISEFIGNGGIYSNIKRMKRIYEKKCAAALEELNALPFRDRLSVIGEKTAAFFGLFAHTDKSGYELMAKAAELDIKLLPVSCYELHNNNRSTTFAFGYAELSEADIREGVRLIGEAWDGML